MKTYDNLKKNLKDAQEELTRISAEVASLQAQIAVYDDAKTKRPKDIPVDWEPLVDSKGTLQGWVAPGIDPRFV